MAVDIETQMRDFEMLVHACAGAAEVLPLIPGNHLEGIALTCDYLNSRLVDEYELLHDRLRRDVFPFVSDLKSLAVRHG